jgi:antirestriction protein ArdC
VKREGRKERFGLYEPHRALPHERKRAPDKARSDKNTYEIVTERIINLRVQGVIPWRRPWSSAGAPRNLVSKKVYRGVNFFLLSATKYVSPLWLSMRQANQLGGSVRKDEHSQIVVFWKAIKMRMPGVPTKKLRKQRKVQSFGKDGRSVHGMVKHLRSFVRRRCCATIP